MQRIVTIHCLVVAQLDIDLLPPTYPNVKLVTVLLVSQSQKPSVQVAFDFGSGTAESILDELYSGPINFNRCVEES
jgi:hypothetical protein